MPVRAAGFRLRLAVPHGDLVMPHRQQRRGFTLIELLVAIAIIAVLAGLTILIGPMLQRTQQSSRGAEQVQGSIFAAKQTALRDARLYGVRLLPDPDGNFRSMQYITQPDDYVRNYISVAPGSPNTVNFFQSTPTGQFFPADISDGLGSDPSIWPIQVGDYIQIQSGANPRRIVGYGFNQNGQPIQVTTASANTVVPFPTTDFRIIRGARPVPGEEIILLPDDVIIDPVRSQPPLPAAPVDILFNPNGNVVANGVLPGKIILWVRDVNVNPATAREQSLIVVYTRSGYTASYQVDVGSADPYSYTYDSRPNGF
jgi:prepilin-type N-terminal cleavage/methylation domain-containing protein